MNNTLKKFISVFLAVVMIFQVAPLSVFAAERSSNIAEDSQSNVSLKQSLAEIIEETKTIIPEDLKKELSKNYSYRDLSKKHKNELSDFLNVSSETLGKLSNQISNSNDIAAVVLNSLDTGISIDTLLEISKNYSVDECLNLERKFKYLSDNIISKQYIDNFAKLVVSDNNTKLDDLYGAVIL